MVKTVKIGGGEVILAANAATPYRYRQAFHEDLFKIFTESANKSEEESYDLADVVTKLAYIMVRQGEKADMNYVGVDDFLEWLEDFAPMDIVLAGEEIINFYMSSTQGSVEPKKK